jgi:hypothetical protein
MGRMIIILLYCFLGLLPSHGRIYRFDSFDDKREKVLEAAHRFEEEDEMEGKFGIGYY